MNYGIFQRIKQHGKQAAFHNDAWSELINKGFNMVGVDKETRDALQPVVGLVKNPLPSSGAIPNSAVQGANAAEPISTAPSFANNLTAAKYKGVPVIAIVSGIAAIAIIYIIVKKGK